jgi:periplasmic protein TonB
MPLNVRGWFISVLAIICSFIIPAAAQNAANVPVPSPITAPQQPTSGDIMRDRISKAKAFIAVRNYNAAIYELENIRRESGDPAVSTVTNVLLMKSFLEQGDFKRAQGLLNDLYTKQKTADNAAAAAYKSVAAQVNSSARVRAERYRSLGLSVADRTLPLEALTDLEKMRETLEIVVTQSSEMAKDPKRAGDAMALIEEAGSSRSMLARDDFDSRRWRDTVSDTREAMMNPSNTVLDAVSGPPVAEIGAAPQPVSATVASLPPPKAVESPTVDRPVVSVPITREREVKIPTPVAAAPSVAEKKPKPVLAAEPVAKAVPAAPAETPVVKGEISEPIVIGSLIDYATRQPPPIYPPAARSIRATGVVRVEVMVDENGQVSEVQKATGHSLLQAAAKDAILKWRFRPFVRDGQPVKATGFVSFNFK